MEGRILITKYLVIIFILISFPLTSILGYCKIIITLELKINRLLKFLDTINILHIFTRMLPFDTGSYLSKIL